MKDYWIEPEEEKKINRKKIIIAIVITMIVIFVASLITVYYTNKPVREWIDKNVFRKEVMQDKVATIELTNEENSNIYTFNKYIGILNKNKFKIYNNSGNEEVNLDVQISSPIFHSSNRFLVIGEKKGQKLYLITDKQVSWEANIEGNIAQVRVNKNGYVAVIITNTSYKTVVAMYNPEGKEMFKTYLSSTRAVDVSVSNDNKHLAIAEVDTSGTIIKSDIKVISVEKASTDPTNSLEKTYQSENNRFITNIEYQDKNRLVCMYTDGIHVIENEQDNSLIENQDKKVIFQSIELNNYAISVEEKSSGLFTADSVISIFQVENRSSKEYVVNEVTKEIYTKGNIIALNLGTEVEFINTDGWLAKRYIANQEITNVVISDNIAGIIYRDKIEIINL